MVPPLWGAILHEPTHNVLLYANSPSLSADTEPDGILRGVYYPHGLAFSMDGRYLFVADAGAPCIHVYEKAADDWGGVRSPVATVRIMPEAVFRKGRHSPAQGGPKGLDIHGDANILVVTSEFQPLAFFEASALLQPADAGDEGIELGRDTSYEVMLLQDRRRAREIVESLHNSTSWRITAPLRRLKATVSRLRALG